MNKNSRDIVIVDGVRTAFVKAGTKFKRIHASELGRLALKELINKTNLDVEVVDEVITGNIANPSDAVNISRVIALSAGLPLKVSACSVHRNCAAALEAICSGYEKIKSGTMETVVAGGSENMSLVPLLFTDRFSEIFGEFAFAKSVGKRLQALKKLQLKDLKPRVGILEGLMDPFVGINMGQTAEILAKEFKISRAEQDQFALLSHQKAVNATHNGKLLEEIVPVSLPPQYSEVIDRDFGPRDNQTLEQLGKLKPFFERNTGTITVGNACPITDGAGYVLLMSREKAEAMGYKPLARIRGYGFVGLEPARMGLGPVYSTPLALKRAGISFQDIGLIELNEAFAAQVLACKKAFASDQFAQDKLGLSKAIGEINPQIMNVNGGAIALGHPVGATGVRLVLTLMKEMKRQQIQFGLATLCIGGGQGGSIIIENEG